MRMLGNRAIVEYNREHNTVLCTGLNGLSIIRATEWIDADDAEKNRYAENAIHDAEEATNAYNKAYNADSSYRERLGFRANQLIQEANESLLEQQESHTRMGENINYLETNPQIAVIKHPNINLPYNTGDKVFLHYMAWEWAEKVDDGHLIDTDFILFQIMPDGAFKLPDNLYLGEAIVNDDEVSPSGIITELGKKDNLKIKLTHLPPNSVFELGDIVLSIDKNNYEFDYWGKKYIKIMRDEIVGKITN